MNLLAAYVFTGLVTGAFYALMAVSMQVIYASSRIMNFAQGGFVLIGSFMMYLLAGKAEVPVWVAFFLVILIGGVFGATYQLLTVRPLYRNPGTPPMAGTLCTVAGAAAIEGLFLMIFGINPYPVPPLVSGPPTFMGLVAITPMDIVLLCVTVVIFVAMYLFFARTWTGRGMIATAQNREGALVVGIRTGNVVTIAFTLSAIISFAAGAIIGPLETAQSQLGQTTYVLPAFIATLLGGLNSPVSAGAGGLVLGIMTALVDGYLGPSYDAVWLLLILIVVLFIRPNGLFGSRRVVQ